MSLQYNSDTLQDCTIKTTLSNFDYYEIWQVKKDFFLEYAFVNFHQLEKLGLSVSAEHYDQVYKHDIENSSQLRSMNAHQLLEHFFEVFNLSFPSDFTGHSLSVSDVIILRKGSTSFAFFVDSFGYIEIPSFLGEEEQTFIVEITEVSQKLVPRRGKSAEDAISIVKSLYNNEDIILTDVDIKEIRFEIYQESCK